jgi:hypothetical protein
MASSEQRGTNGECRSTGAEERVQHSEGEWVREERCKAQMERGVEAWQTQRPLATEAPPSKRRQRKDYGLSQFMSLRPFAIYVVRVTR